MGQKTNDYRHVISRMTLEHFYFKSKILSLEAADDETNVVVSQQQ